jgi:hypothetical protein
MSKKTTLAVIVFVSLFFASTFLLAGSVIAQDILGGATDASQAYSGSSGYKMTVSYQVLGGGNPSAPKIYYVDLNGHSQSQNIPLSPNTITVTMGKNKDWSVFPNPLSGSTSSERWYSIDTLSGKSPYSGGSATCSFKFQHQYKITFTVDPPNSGTTTPSGTNWYSSGQILNIAATKKDSYTFASWTKTGSSTIADASSSTTTVTINGAGTITANFAKPKDTCLTVSAYPKTINKIGGQVTTITGKLTSGSTGVPSKPITLMYNYGNGYNLITTVTTDSLGSYKYDWNIPDSLPNGLYVIKASFAGDGNYKASSVETSCRGDITVVPEYPYGTIAAMAACFVGFMVFKKRSNIQHFKRL